ncbi:MAG: NADPH-dependent oxidoreductase [Ancrocorticia sp.]
MESMNATIATQLAHRTIRKFTSEPVSAETFNQLMEVARSTATSRNLQNASIIRVTNQALKDELAVIATQGYMAEAPELLIFIVDVHRAQGVLDELGSDAPNSRSMNAFFEGVTDAILMAQNVVVAAESLGLGTNYFGNIHNNPARVVELLKLPKLTFPVLGLSFGYPNQEPQLKPRMEMSLRVMENAYQEPESWLEALAEYDEVMQTYYDLRDEGRRNDSFTQQVVARLAVEPANRTHMMRVAQAQGFDFALMG